MNINDTLRYIDCGLPKEVRKRKDFGDFEGANRYIDMYLQRDDVPDAMKYCLTAQKEMMRRIPQNYIYTYEQAMDRIHQEIPDFTEEEFNACIDTGRVHWVYIDGVPHYIDSFFGSMCKDPAIAKRAGRKNEPTMMPGTDETFRNYSIKQMKTNGKMGLRMTIRASVRIKDECFKPGFVRVHLPIPAECETQSEIEIRGMNPAGGIVAPGTSRARTICWEVDLKENTEFWVEYSYVHTEWYHDTEHMTPDAWQPSFCTEEQAPHILFTPYLKRLTAEVTCGCPNNLEKARAIYDWITKNVVYSFVPDYIINENIPESMARNYTGDCGIYALLFITMCRIAGIPAQWQSGLDAEPFDVGAHDWARFYIAPYGWLYADGSFGAGSERSGNEESRKFYFGNLDPGRMVANNASHQMFDIEKKHWRFDPYDNQTGEMEYEDRMIDHDEYVRRQVMTECEEVF